VLTNIIGNVTIKTNDTSVSRIAVHVTNPLLAGSQTVIRWDTPSSVANQQVQIALRSKQGISVIAEAPFFGGTASVQIPCTAPAGSASIELLSVNDKSVIAWSAITISPAGRDCVR
jgi:hypothetical protein